MILIIPIILGAAALITAGVGVATGVNGMSNMEKAKKIGKYSQHRYKQAHTSIEEPLNVTQNLAEEYGQLQIQVKIQTIKRFISFIERMGQQASHNDKSCFDGWDEISLEQMQEYKTAVLEAQNLLAGGLKAAGVGMAAGQSSVALIGLFGTASTGAAISGLSGAAAWNATLAWFGGGSLAVGGGGMALGAWILGGIAVGPALMIGGFVLGGQGEESLTKAYEYETQVNIEIEKLNAYKDFLGQIQRRIIELTELVNFLNNKVIDGLIELESKPFVRERDAGKFQQVALLIKALAEIMKTPILDNEGNLNQETATLKPKYYTFL